ncbi:MAG: ion transporter [Deltaproteobacteria bacterium]|nr:MAG: ion transporter [Deltaproteobacteria bacterium]
MVKLCRTIAESKIFQNLILLLIIVAGAVVGLETYASIAKEHHTILGYMNTLIISAFTLEAVIKIVACGNKPLDYFKNPWNLFDFIIVVVCFLPIGGHYAAVLRLVRIARVLRLVTVLPKLQLIVGALLKSVPSMFYIAVLMTLHFYIYAVMGTMMFQANDPTHFGDLHTSMLTMFQVLTLENWSGLMRAQMLGANPMTWTAPFFFISFILLGTMLMLNLIIGVVINSMEEVRQEEDAKQRAEILAQSEISSADEIQLLISQLGKFQNKLKEVKHQIRLEEKEHAGKTPPNIETPTPSSPKGVPLPSA